MNKEDFRTVSSEQSQSEPASHDSVLEASDGINKNRSTDRQTESSASEAQPVVKSESDTAKKKLKDHSNQQKTRKSADNQMEQSVDYNAVDEFGEPLYTQKSVRGELNKSRKELLKKAGIVIAVTVPLLIFGIVMVVHTFS